MYVDFDSVEFDTNDVGLATEDDRHEGQELVAVEAEEDVAKADALREIILWPKSKSNWSLCEDF